MAPCKLSACISFFNPWKVGTLGTPVYRLGKFQDFFWVLQ
jgi:hypothetical protein